ncbi:hypothetical protein [Maricaulis sp. MIT060901]|uniref:hypothetical protein n=1 Tax=Maricaulis sp. MIT060901 TaxID=3096993 RepID=UPI003999B2C2
MHDPKLEQDKKDSASILTLGLPLGFPVGIAIGVALGVALESLSIGIAIGVAMAMSLSVAFGAGRLNEIKKKQDGETPSDEEKS